MLFFRYLVLGDIVMELESNRIESIKSILIIDFELFNTKREMNQTNPCLN